MENVMGHMCWTTIEDATAALDDFIATNKPNLKKHVSQVVSVVQVKNMKNKEQKSRRGRPCKRKRRDIVSVGDKNVYGYACVVCKSKVGGQTWDVSGHVVYLDARTFIYHCDKKRHRYLCRNSRPPISLPRLPLPNHEEEL